MVRSFITTQRRATFRWPFVCTNVVITNRGDAGARRMKCRAVFPPSPRLWRARRRSKSEGGSDRPFCMYVVSGSGWLSMNAAFQAVWRVVRDIRGMTRPSSAYRPKTLHRACCTRSCVTTSKRSAPRRVVPRTGRPAAIHRGGVSRVLALRISCWRVRALSRRLVPGSIGLSRSPDDGRSSAARRC